MWIQSLYLVVLVMGSLCQIAEGQTYENFTNLQTDLLTSYEKNARPLNNQSEILNVNITLAILTMPEVDSVKGTYDLGIQLYIRWKDERMAWTPSDYGNISEIVLPKADVFVPLIIFGNSIELKTVDFSWMRIKYSYDGTAFYDPGNFASLTCAFYMKFWPFDKQVCYLTLYAYGHDINQMTFTAGNPGVITRFFEQPGEWRVDTADVDYRIGIGYYLASASYKIKMSRQATYYVLTMILPMCVIGCLSVLVFFLPRDAGTRVGFSLTNLLSLAVFLSVITNTIPKGTNPVPVLCIFILFAVVAIAISAAINIHTSSISKRKNGEPIPTIYKYLVMISFVKRSKPKGSKVEHSDKETDSTKVDLKNASENNSANHEKGQEKEIAKSDANDENITWNDVCIAVDRVSLFGIIAAVIVPCLIILIYIVAASDYNDPQTPF